MSDDWQDWDEVDEAPTTAPNTTVPSPIPPWSRPVQSPQTQLCTGDDSISLTMDTTFLNQTNPKLVNNVVTPYTLLLPDGNYVRQYKSIFVVGANQATTAQFRVVSNNFMGFGSLLFSPTGWSAMLQWDGAKWHLVGGNAEPQN